VNIRNLKGILGIGLLVAPALVAQGCVDDDVLYEDQPSWTEANDPVYGFLGYEDVEAKTPVCWTCHPGLQAQWQETAHADAWEGLQSSGHAESYCEPCHTVGSLGNVSTNPLAGHANAGEERFQDVQCESCHGPGLPHVANPAAIRPQASFEAGLGAENGCGECHSGAHHPFVEQWAQSAHGLGPHTEYASAIAPSCKACHEGQTALEVTFGVTTDYLEKGDGELRSITCVVCHDPHGSPYQGQLRASVDVPTEDHLCMRCHSRTGTPWSSHGPHAAQGLLLFGEDVGYLPQGFSFQDQEFRNNHGPENNPRLCTTCHVSRLTVADAGGNFLLESVGHTFEAVSCLDSQGLPVAGGDCEVTDRTFASCVGSGCHGNEVVTRSRYVKLQRDLNSLLDQLWADTDGDHVLEGTDGGLLPQLVARGDASELDPDTPAVTPAKGAMWNAMLAWTDDRAHWSDGEVDGKHFSAHPNGGNGVHNPHLLKALLLANIGEVRSYYGLPAGAPPEDGASQTRGIRPTKGGSR